MNIYLYLVSTRYLRYKHYLNCLSYPRTPSNTGKINVKEKNTKYSSFGGNIRVHSGPIEISNVNTISVRDEDDVLLPIDVVLFSYPTQTIRWPATIQSSFSLEYFSPRYNDRSHLRFGGFFFFCSRLL